MPPALTTEQLNRVLEVLDNQETEEGGLTFVIEKMEDRQEQNILDDSIYRDFINFYIQEVIDGLDTQKAFLDATDPNLNPHRIVEGGDFPPSGGDAADNDLNDWAIWKGPNGTVSASAVTAAGDPGGIGNTAVSLSPGGPANGLTTGDEILMKTGPGAGTSFPIIGISTVTLPGSPIVAGNQTGTGTGNIVAALVYLGMTSGGTVVKISAGNAAIVFRRNPPINFNPTAEPDATIDNAVVLGNPFFFMRFDDRVGTQPQLSTKTDQVDFLEEFLEETEGKNAAYQTEVGTP